MCSAVFWAVAGPGHSSRLTTVKTSTVRHPALTSLCASEKDSACAWLLSSDTDSSFCTASAVLGDAASSCLVAGSPGSAGAVEVVVATVLTITSSAGASLCVEFSKEASAVEECCSASDSAAISRARSDELGSEPLAARRRHRRAWRRRLAEQRVHRPAGTSPTQHVPINHCRVVVLGPLDRRRLLGNLHGQHRTRRRLLAHCRRDNHINAVLLPRWLGRIAHLAARRVRARRFRRPGRHQQSLLSLRPSRQDTANF
ncbi:hypothetical protein MRX96_019736 [Rhipicephalus microplus]